ncbi:hypothetical protein Taro_034219 [Colocasia esculenta]|uniref:Uncharacterized protein n=1 Tax=Colocasia esculenta TaxID=4460 RepID=A0A843VX91_COLES|nr:hypothetical protein [Colocasia esculenta]
MERRRYCFDSPDQTSAKDSIVSRHVVDDQEVNDLGHNPWGRPQVVDGGRNDQRISVWGRNPYKIFVREGYSLLGLCACRTGGI